MPAPPTGASNSGAHAQGDRNAQRPLDPQRQRNVRRPSARWLGLGGRWWYDEVHGGKETDDAETTRQCRRWLGALRRVPFLRTIDIDGRQVGIVHTLGLTTDWTRLETTIAERQAITAGLARDDRVLAAIDYVPNSGEGGTSQRRCPNALPARFVSGLPRAATDRPNRSVVTYARCANTRRRAAGASTLSSSRPSTKAKQPTAAGAAAAIRLARVTVLPPPLSERPQRWGEDSQIAASSGPIWFWREHRRRARSAERRHPRSFSCTPRGAAASSRRCSSCEYRRHAQSATLWHPRH